MKYLLTLAAFLMMTSLSALASETSFDRTLTVNGQVELSVSTGSGNIHLFHGSDTRVHIFARIKCGWGCDEGKMRELAARPPIEQTGNIVRIGARHESLHNISIDYEIEAPANSILEATSGSGNVVIDGVGVNARLSTGSGNIHANGLRDGFSATTGSGDISIEQAGSGDGKAQTGSGNIELRGVRGGLRAGTGSGNIRISGTPSAPWNLHTGSGNVEFNSNGASFTLDASSGSGSIHTDREMLTQGSQERHHVYGKIGGGGSTVRIDTGSGDIRVQ
jgi:DUF4097 and DUF4098 domain-containing protein YvlB